VFVPSGGSVPRGGTTLYSKTPKNGNGITSLHSLYKITCVRLKPF
jgi:hypothetical protein